MPALCNDCNRVESFDKSRTARIRRVKRYDTYAKRSLPQYQNTIYSRRDVDDARTATGRLSNSRLVCTSTTVIARHKCPLFSRISPLLPVESPSPRFSLPLVPLLQSKLCIPTTVSELPSLAYFPVGLLSSQGVRYFSLLRLPFVILL